MKHATSCWFRLCLFVWCALVPVAAFAQAGGQSTLRVTVRDETEAALIHATVTLTDSTGVPRQVLVDQSGVASFTGLMPGPYQIAVEAEGFQSFAGPYTMRRGNNTAIATLTVAFREQVEVKEITAEARRDNGFTTILRKEDIDALVGRPRRDGGATDADGRAGRADLHRRLPRRPPAAEGSDSADSLQHQLVLCRVPRSGHGPHRGDHQARHGQLARDDELRLPRRVDERAPTSSRPNALPSSRGDSWSTCRDRSPRAKRGCPSQRTATCRTTRKPSWRGRRPARSTTRCGGRSTEWV